MFNSVAAKKPRVPEEAIIAGLRAFFRIQELWGISNDQAQTLLGRPAESTFFNWKRGDVRKSAFNVDLATRLSYLLGIFKALELLYKNPQLADRWVAQPNLAFGGNSALQHMMGGQITDLARVRDYLDSVRGGR